MLDLEAIERAVALLTAGQVVAVPSETVYGLAADAYCQQAIERIFQLKQRPTHNPLIVHYACLEDVQRDVVLPEFALALAHAFWPGPMTLVLTPREGSRIGLGARAGLPSVAVRVPDHPVFQAVLRALRRPLAAPSANLSGRLSPTCAAHVLKHFPDMCVLDGGEARWGLESTVIEGRSFVRQATDCPEHLCVLRLGAISKDALAACLGRPVVQSTACSGPSTEHCTLFQSADTQGAGGGFAVSSNGVESPGQLLAHYAPCKPLRCNATSAEANEGVLNFGPRAVEGGCVSLNLSQSGDVQEAASRLFAFLHQLESAPCARIAVAPIPMCGVGAAMNDRLRRAAAGSSGVRG